MRDHWKMPYALCTRPAVSALIVTRTGIPLPVRTIGQYLKRWGFTAQKPIRRAYKHIWPPRWVKHSIDDGQKYPVKYAA